MRERCLEQAEAVEKRIGEAVECLRDGNHLGALGALEGIHERVIELSTALKIIHELSYRKKNLKFRVLSYDTQETHSKRRKGENACDRPTTQTHHRPRPHSQ